MKIKASINLQIANDEDKRIREIFAFIPYLCENNHWHWLEKVKVREKYSSYSSRWWNNDHLWRIHQKFLILHCICDKKEEK